MGTIQHHAIVATSYCDQIDDLKAWAKENVPNAHMAYQDGYSTNGYISVVMFPDGSKEWWGRSDDGDDDRKTFIDYLKAHHWSFVEVGYGELGLSVTDDSGIKLSVG